MQVTIRPDSPARFYALVAGLKKKAFYSVSETAEYLGVDRRVLDAEHAAGRLTYVMPRCKERGSYISVDEVDRWIRENSR